MEEKIETKLEKRRKVLNTGVGEKEETREEVVKDNNEKGTLCPSETSTW